MNSLSKTQFRDLGFFGMFFALSPLLSLLPFGEFIVNLLLPATMLFLTLKRSIQLYLITEFSILVIRLAYNLGPVAMLELIMFPLVVPASLLGIYIFKRFHEKDLAFAFVGYLVVPFILVVGVGAVILVFVVISNVQTIIAMLLRVADILEQASATMPHPNVPVNVELPSWATLFLQSSIPAFLLSLPVIAVIFVWLEYKVLKSIQRRVSPSQFRT